MVIRERSIESKETKYRTVRVRPDTYVRIVQISSERGVNYVDLLSDLTLQAMSGKPMEMLPKTPFELMQERLERIETKLNAVMKEMFTMRRQEKNGNWVKVKPKKSQIEEEIEKFGGVQVPGFEGKQDESNPAYLAALLEKLKGADRGESQFDALMRETEEEGKTDA